MQRTNFSIVKKADLSHIPGIRAINQQNLLESKEGQSQEDIEQSGFLLSHHPEEDLANWIQDERQHLVLVAENEHGVVGYIMACDMKLIGDISGLTEVRKLMEQHKVLYHKQIGIKVSKKGYGGKLLSALCEAAKERGYDYVICKISHAPYENKTSIALHKKYGFSYLTMLTDEYCRAGVYVKAL